VNATELKQWGDLLVGLWLLLGVVAVVIEGVRRIIKDSRALVKYLAHLVRIPLAGVTTIAAAFATWAAFAGMGHWWEGFAATFLGGSGIILWFSLMMAPVFIGIELLGRLAEKRKSCSQPPPQVW
jgi:TctA family transporter